MKTSIAGTHLRPGSTNVSVIHFIDDCDDSVICLPFAWFVFLKYKFSNVRFVICQDLSTCIGTAFMMVTWNFLPCRIIIWFKILRYL